MTEHWLFLCAAYLATVVGFGSSTILVLVAIFFMDLKTAVFIVACFYLFENREYYALLPALILIAYRASEPARAFCLKLTRRCSIMSFRAHFFWAG